MAISYLQLFLRLSTLCGLIEVSAETNEKDLVEQLFLDISIYSVVNSVDGIPTIEPWASQYVAALQERRFGDAIWARYHMMGEVENGIVGDTNLTVPQSIEEDAVGYKTYAPEQFAQALSIYANTSSEDTKPDILELILNVKALDSTGLEDRTTYSIRCSGDHLAYRSSCYQVLDHMSQQKTLIGTGDRTLFSYHSCLLRVGPYNGGGDLTYNTAHAVARLIEEQCARVPACCNSVKVSGYSPRNSGHRKVCLSSKSTGCS